RVLPALVVGVVEAHTAGADLEVEAAERVTGADTAAAGSGCGGVGGAAVELVGRLAVAGGIDRPFLDCGLKARSGSRNVLRKESFADERRLDSPGQRRAPNDVPQPKWGEEFAQSQRHIGAQLPIHVQPLQEQHAGADRDAVAVYPRQAVLEVGLVEES